MFKTGVFETQKRERNAKKESGDKNRLVRGQTGFGAGKTELQVFFISIFTVLSTEIRL